MTPATEAVTQPTDPQHQLNHIDPPMSCRTPDLTANAVTVLERRYLKKDPDTGEVIETPAQLFWRVASHVAKAELAYAPGNYERAMAVATEFYDLGVDPGETTDLSADKPIAHDALLGLLRAWRYDTDAPMSKPGPRPT